MRRAAFGIAFVTAALALSAPARAEDKAAPQITHVPVTKATKGEPVTVTAQFKDESEIFAPTLYFRGPGKGKFASVPMVKQADVWAGTIPTPPPVEYWIEVFDEFGNGPARTGSPTKPHRIEAVEKAKAPVAKQKVPKVLPGPTIVHVPISSARKGSVVTFHVKFEAPNGVFAPTVYLRKADGSSVQSHTLAKTGDEYTTSFVLDGPTDYWLEAFDEQGNGPSRLGSEAIPMRIEAEAVVEPPPPPPVVVVPPPPPPRWFEGSWAGVSKTWWFAGAAGVVLAGTAVGVAAANAGPPAPVLQGLVAPHR